MAWELMKASNCFERWWRRDGAPRRRDGTRNRGPVRVPGAGLFERHGLPVLAGGVATTPEEAARSPNASAVGWSVKAQVKAAAEVGRWRQLTLRPG